MMTASDHGTIHLPAHSPCRRPDPHIAVEAVKAPDDLPPYLFMGHLDASTFALDPRGWSATWGQGSRDGFRLDYDRESGILKAEGQWLGVHSRLFPQGRTPLTELAQLRCLCPIDAWEEKARSTLPARWNLMYLAAGKGDPVIAGVPEGPLKTLLLPIAVDFLPQLVECFARFGDDPRMDFPVNGFITPVRGAVNYVEGRNPDWSQDAGELFMRTFFATGFPPSDTPVREQGSDGSAAWTIRRIAYLAFINVPLAGLVTLLEQLERAGLLSKGPVRSVSQQPGLDSVEFSGCIVPFGKEFEAESIDWMSPDRARRVHWRMPEDYVEVFRSRQAYRTDEPAVARRAAAEVVTKSREWLREAFEI
jgi:hypothetical protein